MSTKLLSSILIICIMSCKTKTNQIVNHKREGKWITTDTLDSIYITKGTYHKGEEMGIWKYYYNGKLTQKERYRHSICYTTFYHPNGKVMKKGTTKWDETENHWYYFGDWYFYNKKGRLDSISNYKKENQSELEKSNK